MKKGIMKRLGTALLAGLLCLTSLSLVPTKVQAATVTHGNVQIIDTDYSGSMDIRQSSASVDMEDSAKKKENQGEA